jgi:hypothetical protein
MLRASSNRASSNIVSFTIQDCTNVPTGQAINTTAKLQSAKPKLVIGICFGAVMFVLGLLLIVSRLAMIS